MSNCKPKVCDIIRSIIDNRITKEDTHCKLCKDIKIHKNQIIEHYQFIGFKLIGLDGNVHDSDYAYYENYSNDIKDLQSKLTNSLRNAGYDANHVILQPANSKNHWSLSFTIIATDYHNENHKNKKAHSVCVGHINNINS